MAASTGSARAIALAFVFSFSIPSLSQLPGGWKEVPSTAGGFTVSLPGEIDGSSGTNQIRSVQVRSKGPQGVFSVTASFWPVSINSRPEAASFLDGLNKPHSDNTGTEKYLSSKHVEYQGLPARVIQAETSRNGLKFYSTYVDVMAGNRIFSLICSTADAKSPVTEAVLKSFRVWNPIYVNPDETVLLEFPKWGFAVRMKGFPEEEERSAGQSRFFSVSNYSEQVTVADYSPKPWSDASTVLDQIEKDQGGLCGARRGSLLSHTAVVGEGTSGRRLRIRCEGKDSPVEMLVILKGNRMFMMTFSAPFPEQQQISYATKFFESLTFK
jgi:hypothetical protein